MNENLVFRIRSYAKINWHLRILDLRSDGYHNIDSLVQLIALFDEIEIAPCGSSDQVSCNLPIPTDEGSLLIRTMTGLRNTHHGVRSQYFSIKIHKTIPPGGGLGGGSSNAAAIIQALNHLFCLKLSPSDLVEYASELGSDIPFFVGGHPFARIEGRGERIVPITPVPEHALVLVFPGFGISTGWAYREWDRHVREAPPARRPGGHLDDRLTQGSPLPLGDLIWNDFERIVFNRYPELVRLKQRMFREGCTHSFMSGSGSTLVGLTDSEGEARCVVRNLQKLGIHAVSTSTRLPDRGLGHFVNPKGGCIPCPTPLS